MVTAEHLAAFLDKAKDDKKGLVFLKNTAVKFHQFDLAAELRQMEQDLFPDTPDSVEAREMGESVKTVFGMIGVGVSEKLGWIVAQTMHTYNEKGGQFDIESSARILALAEKYFGED